MALQVRHGGKSARVRTFPTSIAVLAIALAGAAVVWRSGGTSPAPRPALDPEPIAAVAATEFPTTTGRPVSLAGARGSKVILFFYDGAG